MTNRLMGLDYLKSQLALRRVRVLERYRYYEQKMDLYDFRISSPEKMQMMGYPIGWCTKAVDILADRLVFAGFSEDLMRFNEIFALNNADVLFHSAILSALISSCCFICVSEGPDGFPELRVIDGGNATGIMDRQTSMLREGYAILERHPITRMPVVEAYFTPEYTYVTDNGQTWEYKNPAAYPLLVPIVFRPSDTRPFGHSRISRACMNIMQSAMRTAKRSEITAEFYSYPQRYALGIDSDADFSKWEASISKFLRIGRDEDGNLPQVGQFPQSTMEPHISQLRMFASMFAMETSLTLDDLGFVTDNPSSAEAIKAAHENLRLTARDAQRTFSTGFLNVGLLGASVRDHKAYERYAMVRTDGERVVRPKWEPIFEPDAAMLSGIGDGLIKINQAIPGFFGLENTRDLTGIEAGKYASEQGESWM